MNEGDGPASVVLPRQPLSLESGRGPNEKGRRERRVGEPQKGGDGRWSRPLGSMKLDYIPRKAKNQFFNSVPSIIL